MDMTETNYLLIGGGLSSIQAAKTIRERDPHGRILLVGEEPHRPYDRPPLSKEFLRGEKSKEALFFEPESYFQDRRLELRLGRAVSQFDPSRKRAALTGGETISFEKALLATGGRPIRFNGPGADLPGVHYLRTLDDSLQIAAASGPGRHAVVIGAGFIGMELAASLCQRGTRVTVLERQSRIWSRFVEPTLSAFFQSYFTAKGVRFLTNEEVGEIRGPGRVRSVLTRSGVQLPCDLVCVGIGIQPNVELAERGGLSVDDGVAVNEYLQSSDPDVYAAGDLANYIDPIFGKRRRVEHWGQAEYTGQLAGRNMVGEKSPYDLLTYVWSDLFDLHLEFAGDESEHDEMLVRGKIEEHSFILLYLKQQVLRAYFAVNTDSKEYPVFQRLIRKKQNIAGKEGALSDPSYNVRALL